MKNSFCRISGDELSLFAPIIKIHILSRKKCCQNTNNVKPLCFHDFFDKIIFTIFYVKTKLSKDKKRKPVVFSRFFSNKIIYTIFYVKSKLSMYKQQKLFCFDEFFAIFFHKIKIVNSHTKTYCLVLTVSISNASNS